MENTVNKNSTRNYGLDVLRCVAMIMVVILHFLDKGGILRDLSDEGSFNAADTVAWLLEAFCIVAVNLYMLMSGYLLYSGSFKLSRLLKLVAKVWLYSVIVGFIGIALGTPTESVDTYFKLRLLFPVSMNTYWFMTAYIFFYMLVPVLGIAAKAMNKAQMKLLIGGLLFFHVMIKTIVPAQLTADAAGMDAMWYVVLYFVAVYIRKFIAAGDVQASEKSTAVGNARNDEKDDAVGKNSNIGASNDSKVRCKSAKSCRISGITCVIGYIAGVLLIFGEAFALRFVYLKTGSLSYILSISYAYNHLLVLFASVALFMAFLKLRLPKKVGGVFAFLGKYSLGVYLLHENLSIRYAWEPLLGCDKATTVISVIGYALYAGIFIFVIGVLVDYVGSILGGSILRFLKNTSVFKSLSAAIEKADNLFAHSTGSANASAASGDKHAAGSVSGQASQDGKVKATPSGGDSNG